MWGDRVVSGRGQRWPERHTTEGASPVCPAVRVHCVPTSTAAWECSANAGGEPLPRLSTSPGPIAHKYCEGKVKSTLHERVKQSPNTHAGKRTCVARCTCAPSRNTDQGVAQRVECEGATPLRPTEVRRAAARTPSGTHTREPGRWRRGAHTRETVTYTWAGRSLGKPRWRPSRVLTCKSLL